MCLAVPAKIKVVEGSRAVVNFGGVTKEISLGIVNGVKKDDYVLVHAGFAIGKAAGEGLGKVVTHTSLNLTTPEELEEYKRRVEELEEERKRLKQAEGIVDEEDEEEDDDDDYEEEDDDTDNTNFFNTIDSKVSNALRSRIFYNKK